MVLVLETSNLRLSYGIIQREIVFVGSSFTFLGLHLKETKLVVTLWKFSLGWFGDKYNLAS